MRCLALVPVLAALLAPAPVAAQCPCVRDSGSCDCGGSDGDRFDFEVRFGRGSRLRFELDIFGRPRPAPRQFYTPYPDPFEFPGQFGRGRPFVVEGVLRDPRLRSGGGFQSTCPSCPGYVSPFAR